MGAPPRVGANNPTLQSGTREGSGVESSLTPVTPGQDAGAGRQAQPANVEPLAVLPVSPPE